MVEQEVPGPRPSTDTARQPPVDRSASVGALGPTWEAVGHRRSARPRGAALRGQAQAPPAGLLAVVCSRGRSGSSPFPLGTWSQPRLSTSPSSPICQGAWKEPCRSAPLAVTGPLTVDPEAALGPGSGLLSLWRQPPQSARDQAGEGPYPPKPVGKDGEASLLLQMQTPTQGCKAQEEPGKHDTMEGTNKA